MLIVPSMQVPTLRVDIAREVSETQAQQEDGLSAEFLRHFCEADDLSRVTQLDIQVDSVTQSLEPLGEHLVNLRHLKLSDSSVFCVRDLGTQLRQLEVLWMSRCGLQDIGGVAASLPLLREFYLPFNDVTDLSPLSGHENLEVLDIEGNAVDDADEVAALGMCPRLRELTLSGNPVCRCSGLLRDKVLSMLPQIAVLDDISADVRTTEPCAADRTQAPDLDAGLLDFVGGVASSSCSAARRSQPRVEDRSFEGTPDVGVSPTPSHPLLAQRLSESPKALGPVCSYACEPDEDELVVEGLKRARPKPHAFTVRPAVNNWFSMDPPDRRQVRSAGTALTSFRPATASNSGLRFEGVHASQDSASDLTRGAPISGGPLAAVRQRRVHGSGAQTAREMDMGIRELLRRYETFTQPSCLPEEELLNRKREADTRRPCTPDVRVHHGTHTQDGDGRLKTSNKGMRGRGLEPLHTSGGCTGRDVGNVVQPTTSTCVGETLLLDTETVIDLE